MAIIYLQLEQAWCLIIFHGSLNVPIEHHPTIRYIVYNGYYKVMSNIPKMGHLPTPVFPNKSLEISKRSHDPCPLQGQGPQFGTPLLSRKFHCLKTKITNWHPDHGLYMDYIHGLYTWIIYMDYMWIIYIYILWIIYMDYRWIICDDMWDDMWEYVA